MEELYLPYKEKRRTKATIARENGLMPLADQMVKNVQDIEKQAVNYINETFTTTDKAISGALDILIEMIAEAAPLRSWLLGEIKSNSSITSSLKAGAEDEKQVFHMYYDFSEKISELPNHRVLALNRGEKNGDINGKI